MQIFTETPRLMLREILPTDDTAMFVLDSDPEVHQFLGNKPVKNIEEVKKVIQFIRQQYIDNGIGRWAVVEKGSGNFVGWAGLKLITEPINNKTNYYDLGYRLIKNYWGKGYATEAAKALVSYGFEQMKLESIYGMCDSLNQSSRNVLQKAGLKYVESFDYENIKHDFFSINNASKL